MTYKSAIDQLRLKISRRNKYFGRPDVDYGDRELMLALSEAQLYLGNNYHLLKKTKQLTMVSAQYEYIMGDSHNSKMPLNTLDILSISMKDDGINDPPLTRVSEMEIKNTYNNNGQYPTMYSLYGVDDDRILHFDNSYADLVLYVNYSERLQGIFDNEDNTDNDTFSDYDESYVSYGGEFKLPKEYHPLIVEGGLANIDESYMQMYLMMVQNKMGSKPQYQKGKGLNYHLGY